MARPWTTGRRRAAAVVLTACLAAAGAARAQEPAASASATVAAPAAPDTASAAAPAAALVDTAAVRRIDPDILDFRRAEPDLWTTGVSPTGAVLMTPVFPGWGQLYAENSWRAALGYGVQMYFWTNLISRDRQARRARDFAATFDAEHTAYRDRYDAAATELWEQMRDFAWWSGGTLLIIALDAYVGAHLFDFGSDPVPVPDRWDEQFGPPGGDLPGAVEAPTLTVFRWRTTF